MKHNYLHLSVLLLSVIIFSSQPACAQPNNSSLVNPVPYRPANNILDEDRISSKPFAEERKAVQNFIENINDARKELAMKQVGLAQQKILMAYNLLPLIMRATPAQRRLTQVEFGGGFYANDLDQRKSYLPVETQSMENLSRSAGPRWVKNTRSESDARIIYITLNLENNKAKTYLDHAKKDITANNIKNAEMHLAELSDKVIKIDDTVSAAIQARDYITLTDNYILAANFFGARSSLSKAATFLNRMKGEDVYKVYHLDIITMHKEIEDLQMAFGKLDADQLKEADINLKKWEKQLGTWANE